jgi:hypothetical protein
VGYLVCRQGAYGATCAELEIHMARRMGKALHQGVSARVNKLTERGLIWDGARVRLNPASGKDQAIHFCAGCQRRTDADKRQLDLFTNSQPSRSEQDLLKGALTRKQWRQIKDGKTSSHIREIARRVLGEEA